MVIESNGWFCTDPDCMQHCKKISETEFRFIQAVWLDTCDGDLEAKNTKDESDNYGVCAGYIDLELYSEEDKECAIASYCYTMETIREIYKDAANQIIAECIFEDYCLYNNNLIDGVVSWDDAEQIIQNYIMKE